VIGQSRAPNPYAEQNVGAAPGQGGYNAYGGGQQQAYGQEQGYAQGGYQQAGGYSNGAAAGGPGGGDDFWGELSATNSNLSTLQEQIQAVRSAHQQSLVSAASVCDGPPLTPDVDGPRRGGARGPAQRPGPSDARTVQEPD